MALLVHIDQRPYGPIRCPLVFRKVLRAEHRQLKVHLTAVEKVDMSGVTQEYNVTSWDQPREHKL